MASNQLPFKLDCGTAPCTVVRKLQSAKFQDGRLQLKWLVLTNGTAGLTQVDRYDSDEAAKVLAANPQIVDMLADEAESMYLDEAQKVAAQPMFELSNVPNDWDNTLKKLL